MEGGERVLRVEHSIDTTSVYFYRYGRRRTVATGHLHETAAAAAVGKSPPGRLYLPVQESRCRQQSKVSK